MPCEIQPDIPVLFLDTVHHFPQTYAYRDELADLWKLNLINLRAAEPSPGLWQTSTDACCARHKVEPLFSALEAYDVWFTGLRRQQSASRANLEEVEPFRLAFGQSDHEGERPGHLDDQGRLDLREGARYPVAAFVRARIHQHRLRALHIVAPRSIGPPFRAMAGPEAGVRHPHSAG
jgi:hypothetical protein